MAVLSPWINDTSADAVGRPAAAAAAAMASISHRLTAAGPADRRRIRQPSGRHCSWMDGQTKTFWRRLRDSVGPNSWFCHRTSSLVSFFWRFYISAISAPDRRSQMIGRRLCLVVRTHGNVALPVHASIRIIYGVSANTSKCLYVKLASCSRLSILHVAAFLFSFTWSGHTDTRTSSWVTSAKSEMVRRRAMAVNCAADVISLTSAWLATVWRHSDVSICV